MKAEISAKKLNNEIIEKIEEISGENIYKCYQCGKCTAGCPAANEMDYGPAQSIRLLQLGFVDNP